MTNQCSLRFVIGLKIVNSVKDLVMIGHENWKVLKNIKKKCPCSRRDLIKTPKHSKNLQIRSSQDTLQNFRLKLN